MTNSIACQALANISACPYAIMQSPSVDGLQGTRHPLAQCGVDSRLADWLICVEVVLANTCQLADHQQDVNQHSRAVGLTQKTLDAGGVQTTSLQKQSECNTTGTMLSPQNMFGCMP